MKPKRKPAKPLSFTGWIFCDELEGRTNKRFGRVLTLWPKGESEPFHKQMIQVRVTPLAAKTAKERAET